jgi:hypothetical protein
LNAAAFGSVPPGVDPFTAWESAFCGTDSAAVNLAKSQAATFNTSGDNGLFTPGSSADPKTARSIANACFWDNPSGLWTQTSSLISITDPTFIPSLDTTITTKDQKVE